jgi:hypothetical protein
MIQYMRSLTKMENGLKKTMIATIRLFSVPEGKIPISVVRYDVP